jgi:hypothetical protein
MSVLSAIAPRTLLAGLAFCLVLGLLSAPDDASARRSKDYDSDDYSYDDSSSRKHARSKASPDVERDDTGRIKRSPAARNEFKRQQPCPSTGRSTGACSGYVIDHVVPLKRGGEDAPENMQWQSIEDAKAKDKIE